MSRPRTAAALLLLSLFLPAQEPTPAQAGSLQEQAGGPVAPKAKPPAAVVTLNFKGGTMATFVAAVRAAEPSANIVLAPRAMEAVVPPMDLRAAGVDQALESACAVAEGSVDVNVKEFRGGGQPVFTVIARERRAQPGPGGTDEAEVFQRVFSLNHLTTTRVAGGQPLRVETILSAVELVTTADGKAPLLRFHEDSGLLLVRGTMSQVNQASEALAVLAADLKTRGERTQVPVEPPPPARDPRQGGEVREKRR